ncbi:MAG: hypothetical protein HOJ48_16340 [Desulfobacula sp.]|nr:hypothetical protein [Desulfobacula sp.]
MQNVLIVAVSRNQKLSIVLLLIVRCIILDLGNLVRHESVVVARTCRHVQKLTINPAKTGEKLHKTY